MLLVCTLPQPWSSLVPGHHISLSTAPLPPCSPFAQLTDLPIPNTTHLTYTPLNLSPIAPDSTSHHFPTSWPFFPQLTHFTPHCTLESFRGGNRRNFLPMKALQRQQDPVLGTWGSQQMAHTAKRHLASFLVTPRFQCHQNKLYLGGSWPSKWSNSTCSAGKTGTAVAQTGCIPNWKST